MLVQGKNIALIEGYQSRTKTAQKLKSETKVMSKQKKELDKKGVNPLSTNNLPNPTIDTIFYETFSGDTLDNLWVENSGTDNMKGVNDSIFGKVLRITCNQPNGDSFIEYDLTKIARGKMLKLKGDIKTENIKRGTQSFEIGQLAIKFQMGDKCIYEAVQNLVGTSDWNTYSAHEDGSSGIDNTDKGSYVFKIPEDAQNVILYLGLQNCTGTIYFKDINVIEYK
jgi:hypothetical protein